MNSNEELPSDHFWNSDEAEQEYYAVGQAITDTEEKLKHAQAQLHTVQAVYDHFSGVPGVAVVLRESNPSRSREWEDEDLNQALNPYWLPAGGRISPEQPPDQWQGSLVVQKVETETCQGEAIFRGDFWEGTERGMPYTYEKRVEWYTPTREVGMSRLRHSLLQGLSPDMPPGAGYDKPLFNRLLEKLIDEVSGDIRRLEEQVVLKFIPDLAPTNLEEVRFRYFLARGAKWNKSLLSSLSWPPLTKYAAPKAEERYGLASYKGICWVCHGRWEPYQFAKATLQTTWEQIERIADRLRERVTAATREKVAVEEEIAALRQRRDAVRTRHYPQLVYKEFWSALQNTGRQDSA